MLKRFLKYLRYSNVILTINLNPFLWGFQFVYEGPTNMDPGMYFISIRVIMIRIAIVIDDGSY